MHQKWTNDESETLAISNLVVIQAEAFEDPSEHPLAFSVLFSKHFNIWKAPAYVFADQALIRTRFTTKSLELFMEEAVSRSSYTRPNHAPQRRRDSITYLVGREGG